MSNVFFSTIADAVQRHLIPHGYSLVVVSLDYKAEKLPEAIQFLMSKNVEGIMISMTFCIEERFIRGFNVKGIPIVFIDSLFDGMLSDAVVTDNINGVYQGVEYLINKGHKRIGIINGPQNFLTARERYTGYLKALRDHNLRIDESIIKFGDYDVKSGYSAVKEFFEQGNLPTAMLSANYRMTIGALEGINEKNLVIPRDLSFITFDDMEISRIYTTKLTSIRQPLTEIGETASKIILGRIENGYTLNPPEIKRLKTRLIERDSVRCIKSL